jgi:FkbM family methyltransferase
VGFDADRQECERLNALGADTRYLPYALGRSDGAKATLHLTVSSGSSSLLEPNDAFLAPFPYRAAMSVQRTVPVTLTTLDRVCADEGVRPDVLKLDIQGGELDVLMGADSALSTTLLVESEVEFNPLYKNQPLFGDVDRFLRDKGWLLLGVRRAYWRRHHAPVADGGTLVHGDALWINESLLERGDRETRLKAIAALASYREFDYVAALAASIEEPKLAERLAPPVPLWARAARTVMGRIARHRQWRAWLDLCCPPSVTDWHDPDDFF